MGRKQKKLQRFKQKVDEWMMHYSIGDCSGCPSFTDDWEVSFEGVSALEAVYLYESTGEKKPTFDIQTLESYLQAKAVLDLNIKNWAEDRAKGWLGKIEFEKMIKELGYSDWVMKAVENQKSKLYQI